MSGDFNNKILRPTGMLVHLESAPFLWCGFGFDNHILPGQGALFFGSITSSQDRHEYSGLGMQLATAGGPSGPTRSFRLSPRMILMTVVAVAAAIVCSLFVVPPQSAQAAMNPPKVQYISSPAVNTCWIQLNVVGGQGLDIFTADRVARMSGWQIIDNDLSAGNVSYASPKLGCQGGSHGRILQGQSVKATWVGVAVALSIALATSIVLPELVIGGFSAMGIGVGRPIAVAVAQCIGYGVGALAGELLSGSPMSRAVAAGAASCLVGAAGGFLKELMKVRDFFQAIGKKLVLTMTRYVNTAVWYAKATMTGICVGTGTACVSVAMGTGDIEDAMQRGISYLGRVAGGEA